MTICFAYMYVVCTGVRFVERCSVIQVTVNGGRVSGVDTSLGHINCHLFVNCAGLVSCLLLAMFFE